MALSSLTGKMTVGVSWTASNSITGSDYAQSTNATNILKTLSIGTSVANAASGGGDELYSAIASLTASSSLSLDLTSFSNIMATSGATFARVKAIVIRVLSTTDDSSIGTVATPCMIDTTVANALVSQSGAGWFKAATSTFDIPNGGVMAFGTPAAGGVLVDATHKVLKITNNDSTVIAKVQVTVIGGSS